MTTCVLVHGAWHGSWCWQSTAEQLHGHGLASVAVDLPAQDPQAGLQDSAQAVLDAWAAAGADGPALMVGHSMGGLVTPLLAGRLPVVGLVFVCALVPRPGVSAADAVAAQPTFSAGWSRRAAAQVTHPDGSSSWPVRPAIEAMYHDCDPGVAQAAAAMLRPQCWRPFDEPSPLAAWPDLPAAWVVTTEDRVVDPRGQRAHAAEHRGTLVELPGGHSPMASRPAELAAAIAGFARSVPAAGPHP